ncbi:MAG: hypothetical protein ABI808_14310 [Pseudonocardiales bacterium]
MKLPTRPFTRLSKGRRRAVMACSAAALVAVPLALIGASASSAAAARAGSSTGPTSGLLPAKKILLQSAEQVDLHNDTVRLPLHRGEFHGTTYWYILTESSDFGLAHDLNVNFAPKLANAAISCPTCVQSVTLSTPANNKFGEGIVHFAGVPDFSPTRVLVPGPGVFPPATATPGAVAGPGYSPFIRINGSAVVYNAPIVAVGDGPFDVTHHTNTADRVLAIHPADAVRGGQFSQPSVDFLFVRGFDAGKPIIYLSTEASDPVAAVLERATFTPLLNQSSLLGGDDFLGSARERIFPFINGQTGSHNRQAQGIRHLILDGHAAEDASLANTALLAALRNGGDLLNSLGDFPSLADPRHANAYSPLWDAQFGQWTDKAIRLGLNTRQSDENQILNLAATRPDLITGAGGSAYGSTGFIINCPIIGFLNQEPVNDLVSLVPHAQG